MKYLLPLFICLLALTARADSFSSCGLVVGQSSAATANSAALDACLSTMRAANRAKLNVGEGNWYFAQPVVLTYGVVLEGVSPSASVIVAMHSGHAIRATGQHGTGGALRNITVAYHTFNGGVGIYLRGEASYQPDFFEVRNVVVTHLTGGTMAYGLIVDGDARAPSTGLQGIRNIAIQRLIIFSVSGGNAFEIRNGRAVHVTDMQLNQGGGTSTVVYVRGSAGGQQKSAGVFFSGCNVGWLVIENTAEFSFVGGVIQSGGTLLASTAWGLVQAPGSANVANYASGNNVRVP